MAVPLIAFAALMIAALGISWGLSERYLEPRGFRGSDYSLSAFNVISDVRALSCGSAWSPLEASPEPDPAPGDSQLNFFGAQRCSAVLAGIGLPAGLLTGFGTGILVILALAGFSNRRSARRKAEDAEFDRMSGPNRSRDEQQRRSGSA